MRERIVLVYIVKFGGVDGLVVMNIGWMALDDHLLPLSRRLFRVFVFCDILKPRSRSRRAASTGAYSGVWNPLDPRRHKTTAALGTIICAKFESLLRKNKSLGREDGGRWGRWKRKKKKRDMTGREVCERMCRGRDQRQSAPSPNSILRAPEGPTLPKPRPQYQQLKPTSERDLVVRREP